MLFSGFSLSFVTLAILAMTAFLCLIFVTSPNSLRRLCKKDSLNVPSLYFLFAAKLQVIVLFLPPICE